MDYQVLSTPINPTSPVSQIGLQPSDDSLEQTLGIHLISDLNSQLDGISDEMKSNLESKNQIRTDIQFTQTILMRESQTDTNGDRILTISESEKNTLIQKGFPTNAFSTNAEGQTTVTFDALNRFAETKKEKLSGLNSDSEITMIQVQSLLDQRKNALAMLSNLMASRNESLMGIIRNLKN